MSSKSNCAKHRLEPLSLKDAVSGPGLSGLKDVLETMVQPHPLGQTGPVLPFVSPGVIVPPGDSKSRGELESPGDSTSPGEHISPDSIAQAAAESEYSDVAVGDTSNEFSECTAIGVIREWKRAQHGMSPSELAVYRFLRDPPKETLSDLKKKRVGYFGDVGAKTTPDNKRDTESNHGVRNARAGIADIALGTFLNKRTCQRVIKSLLAKRVVDVEKSEQSAQEEPRTYKVRSFGEICEIWRSWGFTHVAGSRTRTLIDPSDLNRRISDVRGNWSPGDFKSPGDIKSQRPGDFKSGEPGDMKSPLSIRGNKNRNIERNTQATATSAVNVAVVAAALCEYAAGDRMAAERIVESAQAGCPDCTTEDVVEAIRRKATHLQRQVGIKSSVGVLITSCGELAQAIRNERVATESKQTEETAEREFAQKEADFLASLDGLSSDNLWRQILDRCKDRIPLTSFNTWLLPTQFVGVRDRVLEVYVPSSEFKFVGEKYADCFGQAITELGLELVDIKFETSEEFVRQREESDDDR